MGTRPATTAVNTSVVPSSDTKPSLVRGLGLLDSVLLLVGGIIGSSIFLTAKDIAQALPHPMLYLLVWVVGGGISLCACFAFAELGSMFPDSGGQYVYLRETYGDLTAFLYGWMLFSVGNGGSIAALAVGSAAYLGSMIPVLSQEQVVLSLAGLVVTRVQVVALFLITVVTAVNVFGLRRGTVLQNIATWAKFIAMAAFIILGFAIGKGDWHHFIAHGGTFSGITMHLGFSQMLSAFGVALIAVFWAYDGWVYITWVAGEVKEPRRNVPLAMVSGVLIVGAIYIAMNMTYLYALPLDQVAQHETIAQTSAAVLFSPAAGVWLSALIALSVFGALACAVLSSARVYYAMALDGVFFPQMAKVHPKWRTPAVALIGQSAWAGASHAERALRSALHLCDVRHGAVLHADRDWIVPAALEAPRYSASVSMHGISLATSVLCADWGCLDAEYNYHAAHRSVLGNHNCAGWDTRLFVLEAQQPRVEYTAVLIHRLCVW